MYIPGSENSDPIMTIIFIMNFVRARLFFT